MVSSCLRISARDECAGRATRHTLCPTPPIHTLRSLAGTAAFLTQPQVPPTSGVLSSNLGGPFSSVGTGAAPAPGLQTGSSFHLECPSFAMAHEEAWLAPSMDASPPWCPCCLVADSGLPLGSLRPCSSPTLALTTLYRELQVPREQGQVLYLSDSETRRAVRRT